MKYKPSMLNISSGIFLTWILIYTILNYKILSAGEGWGIVSMAGLAGVGIVAGLVDLILQQFIRNRLVLNFIELIITIGLIIAIWIDL